MPLLEVGGKTGAADPEQIGLIAVKVGVTLLLTVTVSVAVVAHCPAAGVNVYVAVAVLFTVAGLQVPVMPLLEVVGSTGAIDPEQIGAIAVKDGMILLVTVTVSVAVVAHCPAVGVNV
jgi:hypothetical protein